MLGEALALSAAVVWSTSIILFKRSEAIRPLGMNLFKNAAGILLLGVTLIALGRGFDTARSASEWAALLASGILGIGIADTLTFTALRRLGPALLAIVDCMYAPTIVIMSVLFLDEHIGPRFLLGAALVVGGVLLATLEQSKAAGAIAGSLAATGKEGRLGGVLFGLAGIVVMAVGVVLAKRPLQRGSLPEVTMVRLFGGMIAQIVWIAVVPAERTAVRVFVPSRAWRTLVPAAVLGAYVSLLLWLGGFKWANASVAAVLNQMSSVFTILLARVVLGEPVTKRRAIGGAIAVAGALVVLSG